MKVVFYASDKPREHLIADAMQKGVESLGDQFERRRTADYGETRHGDYLKYQGPTPDTDVAVFFGVKGKSRLIMDEHRAMGKTTIYLDKGLTRAKGKGGHTEYTRVAINASHPLDYMMDAKKRPDRFFKLGIDLQPKRKGENIVICGSSMKYHAFHDLPNPTDYAIQIVDQLRKFTGRQIIYRPKPSWRDARPIPRTLFSSGDQSLDEVLKGAHCLITHGSGAAFFAICAGIPVVSLGHSIAHPVAEKDISNIDRPYFPAPVDQARWAAAAAYTQFTLDEFATGAAWLYLKSVIEERIRAGGNF